MLQCDEKQLFNWSVLWWYLRPKTPLWFKGMKSIKPLASDKQSTTKLGFLASAAFLRRDRPTCRCATVDPFLWPRFCKTLRTTSKSRRVGWIATMLVTQTANGCATLNPQCRWIRPLFLVQRATPGCFLWFPRLLGYFAEGKKLF